MTNSLGDFVRERRRANGLTQQELGELASVGTRFISELERGKPTVRLDAIRKVLAVFGKDVGVTDRVPEATETTETEETTEATEVTEVTEVRTEEEQGG